MDRVPIQFEVKVIPDPSDVRFRTVGDGRVAESIRNGFQQLLRVVASSDEATVSIRFEYDPSGAGRDPQTRLRMFISVAAADEKTEGVVVTLLKDGPLARFYPFTSSDKSESHLKLPIRAAVQRRCDRSDPMTDCDLNASIPECYQSAHPFAPKSENDYMPLDRVLNGVDESVVIEITVKSTDAKGVREAHSRYLNRLQTLARSWERRERELFSGDPFRLEDSRESTAVVIEPLERADGAASEIIQTQRRIQEVLRDPLLVFQVVVRAESESTAALVASTAAESAFDAEGFEIVEHSAEDHGGGWARLPQGPDSLGFRPTTSSSKAKSQCIDPLQQLVNIGSVGELEGLFRLPVASGGISLCIHNSTCSRMRHRTGRIVLGRRGGTSDDGPKMTEGVYGRDLCRHAAFFGKSGTGKSTTLINLAIQLWREKVPFLILEPVKAELRAIKSLKGVSNKAAAALADDLRVYTAGDRSVSPLRLNPFTLPSGVTPMEHIDILDYLFQASIPMGGPVPLLLREALEEVFELVSSPTMLDLYEAARRALSRKGYSSGTRSDIGGAIETRLGALTRGVIGKILGGTDCRPSMNDLLTNPSLVETDRLSVSQSSLLVLMILVLLRQAILRLPGSSGKLRFVLIIDEAHILVGRNTDAAPSEDNADPKAFASEFICRMLAEMRSLGVGVVICDQVPSAVAPDVLKNTLTQLVFRQSHEDDLSALAAAVPFEGYEVENLTRLRPGEAYLFSEGFYRPVRIQTVNLHEELNLRPIDDSRLRRIIAREAWYKRHQATVVSDQLLRLADAMDQFESNSAAIAAESVRLTDALSRLLKGVDVGERGSQLIRLNRRLKELKDRLDDALRQFRIRHYIPLLPTEEELRGMGAGIRELRQCLFDRYEHGCAGMTGKCMAMLDSTSRLCRVHVESKPSAEGHQR